MKGALPQGAAPPAGNCCHSREDFPGIFSGAMEKREKTRWKNRDLGFAASPRQRRSRVFPRSKVRLG